MALSERDEIDKIEILPVTGHIQIRKATVVERDGKEISRTFERRVIEPDQDVGDEPDLIHRLVAE